MGHTQSLTGGQSALARARANSHAACAAAGGMAIDGVASATGPDEAKRPAGAALLGSFAAAAPAMTAVVEAQDASSCQGHSADTPSVNGSEWNFGAPLPQPKKAVGRCVPPPFASLPFLAWGLVRHGNSSVLCVAPAHLPRREGGQTKSSALWLAYRGASCVNRASLSPWRPGSCPQREHVATPSPYPAAAS